jgi:hypothetical protein
LVARFIDLRSQTDVIPPTGSTFTRRSHGAHAMNNAIVSGTLFALMAIGFVLPAVALMMM